jgi:hypothetical protein
VTLERSGADQQRAPARQPDGGEAMLGRGHGAAAVVQRRPRCRSGIQAPIPSDDLAGQEGRLRQPVAAHRDLEQRGERPGLGSRVALDDPKPVVASPRRQHGVVHRAAMRHDPNGRRLLALYGGKRETLPHHDSGDGRHEPGVAARRSSASVSSTGNARRTARIAT